MDKNIKSHLDYIGSKVTLAPTVAKVIESHANVSGATLVDIFAGTGAISRWFLQNRNLNTIVTNDFEVYSNAVCVAAMRPIKVHSDLYERLNNAPGKHGFITTHCSPEGYAKRMFFTTHNAGKIDAMKIIVKGMLEKGEITIDKATKLMGEITVAADKVSNTASVYGAYLKVFKKTALREIEVKPLEPEFQTNTKVWNMMFNANDLINDIHGDILYVDPPYNARQYGNNYHVLNYIADPWAQYKYKPVGVTGVHKDWQRSLYCNKKRMTERLTHLIKKASFQYVVMSYSNKGLIPIVELTSILKQYGKVLEVHNVEYKNFKADNNRIYDTDKTTEYIIILRKNLECV